MTTAILSQMDAAAIVNRWHTDPVDVWRQAQRTAGFYHPAGPAYTHALATEVEALAGDILTGKGFTVETTSHKAAYDLVVNHCLNIELKAANWTQGRRYIAKLPAHQRRAADLVLFAVRSTAWRWFIIPTTDINTRTIEITTFNVDDYAGRWARYLGQWSIISAMVPAVRDRTRQMRLAEVV